MGGDFLASQGRHPEQNPPFYHRGGSMGRHTLPPLPEHLAEGGGEGAKKRPHFFAETSAFLCGNVRTSRRKVPHFQRQSPDVSATPDKHRNFRCPQAWGISRNLQKRHRKTSRPASQPRVGGKSRHRARNPTRGTLTGAVRRGGIYGTPSRLCPQDKKKSASAVHRGTCRCGFFRGTLSFRLPSRRIACRALRSGFSAP